MASFEQDEELEPHDLNASDIDKAFKCVVRWLRNEQTTQYFANHPAARETIVNTIHEVTRSKAPLTPAATPCNSHLPDEQPSILLSLPNTTRESSARDSTPSSPPVSQHFARQRGRDSTDEDDVEDEQDSVEDEQDNGPQHSALLDHHNDVQNNCSDGQSSGKTVNLIRKRKVDSQDGGDSKRPHVETESESSDLESARQSECRLRTIPGESQDVQNENLGAHGNRQDSIATSADTDNRFTSLSLSVRAKLSRIADDRTITALWEYLQFKKTVLASTDDSSICADAAEADTCLDSVSASHRRLMELKTCIVRNEKEEKSLKLKRLSVRITKRVALVELIGKYIEERDAWRATPKKIRRKMPPQPSLKDRYTDLLFPETIKSGDEQLSQRIQSAEVIKNKTLRLEAKKKLDSWIQLGEPLLRIAQRYSIGVVPLLPDGVTDKILHRLPRAQIPDLVNYIEFVRPGLERQISNLSATLLHVVNNRLPPQGLVIESLTGNVPLQLRGRSLSDLLQIATNSGSLYQTDRARPLGCAEFGNGNPSSTITKCAEHIPVIASHEESVPQHESSEDVVVKAQSCHLSGLIGAEDYYIEDVDWRAQDPPDVGEWQASNLQDINSRFSSSEPDTVDFDSFINYTP